MDRGLLIIADRLAISWGVDEALLREVLEGIGLFGAVGIIDWILAPDDDLEGLSPLEALKTRPDLHERPGDRSVRRDVI